MIFRGVLLDCTQFLSHILSLLHIRRVPRDFLGCTGSGGIHPIGDIS